VKIGGSVALVTGASSGIGAAVARELATRGATVILHGRSLDRLYVVAARMRGAAVVSADLALPRAAERLATGALAARGYLDIAVMSAGIGYAGRFDTMPPDSIDQLITVNLTGAIRLTRALLPAFLAKGTGYLAYVTSIAGRTGVAGEAVYAATKAGLDAFAESLRYELRGTGVRVGVFVPGVIDTPFFANRGAPYTRQRPRPLAVEPVARAIIEMIEHEDAETYRPRWLRVPIALRGLAPRTFRAFAGRFGGS
jgi:short-subunit dehydrogenase